MRVKIPAIPKRVIPGTLSIGMGADGGGSVLTTGSKGFAEVQANCKIVGWTMIADQSGSITITVKACPRYRFPTTATIVGGNPAKLVSQQINSDSSVSGWLPLLHIGDILEFNIDSATTVTRVQLILKCQLIF